MNDFVHSDLLSPFEEATASRGGSDQNAHSSFDMDGTRLLLRHALKLPDSEIGALSCISEILRDLRPALEMDSNFGEWANALTYCKTQIEQSTQLSEAKDRLLLQGIDTWPMRLLLTPLSSQLSPDARLQIRLIRAKVMLHHLPNRLPFSISFCQTFVEITTAKTDTAKNLGQLICCDRAKLIEARRGLPPESDNYAFVTTLIQCIDAPLKSPPRFRAKQISPVVSKGPFKVYQEDVNKFTNDFLEASISSEDGASNVKQSGEGTEKDSTYENDQIGIHLLETKYARPRDFSGINNLWDFLQPSELEGACRQFVIDLNALNSTAALAALIAVFTRLRPKNFRALPLSWNNSASLWLDLKSGHLCWQLEAAIDRKRWLMRDDTWIGRSPIRIPLPRELIYRLAKMQTIVASASTLGDLFGGHLDTLEKLTRNYLKAISATSHRVTLGRLCSSHARYLLSQCNDEAYACVLGLDFRLGTTANINYCTFKSTKVNTILKGAYLQLGLSGDIAVPVVFDVGSRFIGSIDAVDRIVSESLNDALCAYSAVINRNDFVSLATAHGTISRSILRVLCIVTQHRESSRHSFAHHTIDLEKKLALISDKDISPYLQTRIVPIPELAADWLNFYFRWLELIRYRFLKIDRRISKCADSLVRSRNIRADCSLFFDIKDDGTVTTLGNQDISQSFKRFGLEGNAGRHWADDIFRNSGFDSAILMACSGHACNGQEAFGVRSALDPMRVCDAARQALDKKLDELSLPRPPTLQARKCTIQFVHHHNFAPGGFDAIFSDVPTVEPVWESCPFHEFTLAHARQFIELWKHWQSAGPSQSPETIALSLVFRDGIVNRAEVLSGTKELLTGRIFQSDTQQFIDTDSKELGIRRIWLDQVTFRLASKLTFESLSIEELLQKIQCAFSEVMRSCAVAVVCCPIDEVLRRSRAFYSLYLPGVLRGWSFGEVHARTLRPETVARHASDLVEHPSIEGGRSHRSSHTGALDKFITEAISDACDETTYKGREETRIRDLSSKLSEFEDMPLNSGVLEVLLKFALYLARKLNDPASVKRYYSGLKSFITENCFSLDSIDDFSEIEWHEPMLQFRDLRVAATGKDYDPERTALNHFLDCMGIDRVVLISVDPAGASRRYADFPSPNEVSKVLQIIPEISALSKVRTGQAQTAFDVLVQRYLRWSDISRLRVIDIGSSDPPSIVFSHEAIGKHKTVNSDRVHTQLEPRISESLSALSQLRRKQFPGQINAFLFSNRESCDSISQASEIRRLISAALWYVTGSNFLSVHSGRRAEPTLFVQSILDPELRKTMRALYLRQALHCFAASIGHGDPLTTFANYVCDLDSARRKWVDWICDTAGVTASPAFVAALTDKPVDTIRARNRRQSPLAKTDYLESFNPAANASFQSRIRPLKEFLIEDLTRLNIDAKKVSEDKALSCSVYMAARLLKAEIDLAAFISQISDDSQQNIELGLNRIYQSLGRTFTSDLKISPTQLINNEIFSSASNTLSQFHPEIGASLMLCRAISRPDKPWRISTNESFTPLSDFMQWLDESLIEVVISRNRDSSRHDADTFLAFSGRKFRHRKIHGRHFSRGCLLRFQFVPAGTKLSSLPAKTALANFSITAVAISRFALSLGEHHEQANT